jgi:hypothetical protein
VRRFEGLLPLLISVNHSPDCAIRNRIISSCSPPTEILVDAVEDERGAFIKKYFHAGWPNHSVSHAVLNTAVRNETVIKAILNFLP